MALKVSTVSLHYDPKMIAYDGKTNVMVIEPETEIQKIPVLKELTETEALVGEYIHLNKIFESVDGKKLVARMETIRKELQLIANENNEPELPTIFKSPEGEVEFSPRASITEITNKKDLLDYLIFKFGWEVTLSCVKFGITETKKVLSFLEMAKFSEEKLGSRTLKAVREKD